MIVFQSLWWPFVLVGAPILANVVGKGGGAGQSGSVAAMALIAGSVIGMLALFPISLSGTVMDQIALSLAYFGFCWAVLAPLKGIMRNSAAFGLAVIGIPAGLFLSLLSSWGGHLDREEKSCGSIVRMSDSSSLSTEFTNVEMIGLVRWLPLELHKGERRLPMSIRTAAVSDSLRDGECVSLVANEYGQAWRWNPRVRVWTPVDDTAVAPASR